MLPLLGRSTTNHGNFSDSAELVGILDLDPARVEAFNAGIGLSVPYFSPEQGAEYMIRSVKPDVLIVTGPDYTHCEHILAGLKNDLRVIAEKPVVINCEQMTAVLEAEGKSRGSLVVAHNYRYATLSRKIKELLQNGAVGRITNIEFVYNLNTRHGASYFCRWNRQRQRSGGLSIHKSVHHLDFINWLVGSPPETVFAFGALNYFGPNGAHRPKSPNGSSLSVRETREKCPYFKVFQKHHGFKGDVRSVWDRMNLPFDAQYPEDIYIYDEEIDIEDTYSAVIRYRSGASLTYSCNFSTPWEGYVLGINGTDGRLEASHQSNPDPTGMTNACSEKDVVVTMPLFGGRKEHVVSTEAGGHGGADPLILKDLFSSPSKESNQLELPADSYAGALAIASGEAIWRSAKECRPFHLRELLGEFYRS